VALAAADEGEGALHLRENLRWPHVTFNVMVVAWHDGVACDVGEDARGNRLGAQ
jgi:hypothetical protein